MEYRYSAFEYHGVSRRRQVFMDGRDQMYALTYKEAYWIVLTPLSQMLSFETVESVVEESEKPGTMLIPQPLVVALFLFVADTFPDFAELPSLDVNELVARAKRGDRNAVASLYQIYAQTIYRYVVCRVPTSADAEDLTAEVFVSMVKGLPAYQVTSAPFEAWLYRIAASRIADFYRKSSRRQQRELSDTMLDESPLPEERILQSQTLDLLRDALQQLPEDHQTILILRFVERRSHEEVAVLLDKSVSAVKSAQYRALKRLTQLLGTDQKARHYLRGNQHE